jgi:hypothetical protein
VDNKTTTHATSHAMNPKFDILTLEIDNIACFEIAANSGTRCK